MNRVVEKDPHWTSFVKGSFLPMPSQDAMSMSRHASASQKYILVAAPAAA